MPEGSPDKAKSERKRENTAGEELVAVGKIVRARGIRGEVVVIPLTDFPERFEARASILIELPASETATEYEIAAVRANKSQLLLQFKGVETRDEAEKLVGAYLCVRQDEVVELPADNYYQFELVGMTVVTEDGVTLGELVEVMPFPANDVWRVEGKNEILIPAIKEVVRNVDREAGKITIFPMPGLIPEKPAEASRSRKK